MSQHLNPILGVGIKVKQGGEGNFREASRNVSDVNMEEETRFFTHTPNAVEICTWMKIRTACSPIVYSAAASLIRKLVSQSWNWYSLPKSPTNSTSNQPTKITELSGFASHNEWH